MKILLVEDDLIVQRVHLLMLTKLGCRVDIAENGTVALQKMQDNANYNIIFVDIGLPDISGFELIKILRDRDHAAAKSIPIIALTGYAGDEEKKACFEAGATDVRYKPVVNGVWQEILEQYKERMI